MHIRAKWMILEDYAPNCRKWLTVIDMICIILMVVKFALLISSPNLKENLDLSKKLQQESSTKSIIDIKEKASFLPHLF